MVVNLLKCPCGCELRPTTRLVFVYECLCKEFPSTLERKSGIHCEKYGKLNVNSIEVAISNMSHCWQKERLYKFLSTFSYPFELLVKPDSFGVTMNVVVTEVLYEPSARIT